ncbi:TAXI family TRAP transporter solute-binding subunit [Alkalihalobacillus deserti]|uniref:TAXI family TRAP transporter solute-binding subunit n=1 Tax=Alkalihalobacillus deserti TaxID=2879466 RepID=UPI001D14F9D2|nr:TAXI family TRAP transporter solute-binding subunit [Alkalihalobacillus deserti]
MKKNKVYSLAMITVLLIGILSACGSSADGNESEGTGTNASGIIPVYTPGAGGIAYILSAGIGKIFNSNETMPNVQLVTEATNGGAEIMQMVMNRANQDKAAFGINSAMEVVTTYHGEYENIPGKHENLRAVSYLTYAAAHMVVSANSDIQSYADLKGKKIGLPPGSATEAIMKTLLKDGYGLEESDYKVIPLGYKEIQEGIQNGSIDAGPLLGAIPAPLVNELSQLHDIRFLTIEEAEEKKFLEENTYYSVKKVEAETYPGQDNEITIPSLDVIVFTHETTDEELVYHFIDTILSNQAELQGVHPVAKDISEETIMNGLQIPLHAGAEKYYREKGLIE